MDVTYGCITILVHFYYLIQQCIYTFAFGTYGGHKRYAEQLTQVFIINLAARAQKFIIHVEGTHQTDVHINKLCGKVKITLKIRAVKNIYHYIGYRVNDKIAHE
ncbi:hypothetical protein DSECCO2_661340 [anaerobic digester metagenome]